MFVLNVSRLLRSIFILLCYKLLALAATRKKTQDKLHDALRQRYKFWCGFLAPFKVFQPVAVYQAIFELIVYFKERNFFVGRQSRCWFLKHQHPTRRMQVFSRFLRHKSESQTDTDWKRGNASIGNGTAAGDGGFIPPPLRWNYQLEQSSLFRRANCLLLPSVQWKIHVDFCLNIHSRF